MKTYKTNHNLWMDKLRKKITKEDIERNQKLMKRGEALDIPLALLIRKMKEIKQKLDRIIELLEERLPKPKKSESMTIEEVEERLAG